MQYKKYNLNAYDLHLVKTDKFKTITILIKFIRPIKKEEITIRGFLPSILFRSTKNYPTNRLLNIEAEKLYGLDFGSNNRRIGNYNVLSFELSLLNEKYTEKGILEKSIDILFEVIFNPNIKNNAFKTKDYNIVKNDYTSKLKSIKDDTGQYSIIRMLEEMDIKAPFSYRFGYLEDLDMINEKKLYEYYKSVLKSDAVSVFVLGDIDINQIKEIFRQKFKINTIKNKQKGNPIIEHTTYRKRIKKALENENINQAKLVVGCKTISLTDFERKYVAYVFNSILGGSSYSKLFQNIRDKNALAYNAWSGFRSVDNLLFIYMGINKENYAKAMKITKEILSSMAKGDISEEELESAKKEIMVSIESMQDSADRTINDYFSTDILNLDDIETRKKKFLQVSMEDLKKFAKKIKVDTTFLLYGDDTYEEDRS